MPRKTIAIALAALAGFGCSAIGADWDLVDSTAPESLGEGLSYVQKTVREAGDTGILAKRKLHLVFFEARFFTLKVIDQGTEDDPRYDSLAAAMKANFCPAGCNGGFFHPDFRPLGLMVAGGERSHRFETSKLLSGLIVADGAGLRLLRRAEFQDNAGITALLQAGPFLVDRGVTVTGLSSQPSRRRTFLLWDGGAGDSGRWAIGSASSMTLAGLGAALADADVITELKPHRALNLDGGSSGGLYFDRGAGRDDFIVSPIKRVRNFLGVVPRTDLD